jgi:histidinol-phosphate aminotransferase
MIRANIRAMQGYVPGEQYNDPDIIKLNTNENPYPPSPRVFEAIRAALTGDSLRKYPQPLGETFRNAAGRVLGIDPDSILIGNGSDDILTILTRAFVPEGGLIASPTPSYILYRNLAAIQGARFETIPFTADWKLGENWPRADLAFLPNPNSPSGTVVPADAIEGLAGSVNVLVLDQAYADFMASGGRKFPDASSGTDVPIRGLTPPARPDNVIITRTLSKSYSLAGIRFGFAIAAPELVRELVKVKDSYNCDVLSLAAATAAIEDQEYFRETRAKILATRTRMAVELAKLGFAVTPSEANFLWCRTTRPMKPMYEELKRRKILVRYMNYDGYDGLRISVGTDAEIDRLLAELATIA